MGNHSQLLYIPGPTGFGNQGYIGYTLEKANNKGTNSSFNC